MQGALSAKAIRRRAIAWSIAIVLAIAALWFFSRIPRTLAIFVIATSIAFALQPVVRALERIRVPRGLAIGIVYAGLLAITVAVVFLVVPATLVQIQIIVIDLPRYIATVQGWIDDLQRMVTSHVPASYLPAGYGNLHRVVEDKVSFAITAALASMSTVLITTFTAAFVGVSALVLSAFFLIRGSTIFDPLYALFPARGRVKARLLASEMANVFGAYITGQIIVSTVTGVLIFAFTLATGFKFALLLGLVSGIAYAVPFVGMVFAHMVALVLAAPQGREVTIWVQVIVFTIARVSDNLFVPRVMSEKVGVSPIVVMFAVFAGGELFGIPGLLLGIPAAAIAKVAWQFYRSERATADAEDAGDPPAEPVRLSSV